MLPGLFLRREKNKWKSTRYIYCSVPLAVQSCKTGDGSGSFLSLQCGRACWVISRAACYCTVWPVDTASCPQAHHSHKKNSPHKIHPRNFLRVFCRLSGGLCQLCGHLPAHKKTKSPHRKSPRSEERPASVPLWNHSEPAHRTTGEIRVHWREGFHSGERASKGWPDTR